MAAETPTYLSSPMFWRYIKVQRCVDVPALVRYCYEMRPGVFAGVRVSLN